MNKPKKNTSGKPRKAPKDIRDKQDPGYDDDAFEDALKRVSRRLDDPSEPDPKSPKRAA